MKTYHVVFTAHFYQDEEPFEQLARDIYRKLQLIPSISRYAEKVKSNPSSQLGQHETKRTFQVSAHYEGGIESDQKFIDCCQLFADTNRSGHPCKVNFWDAHSHAYVPYCGPSLFNELYPDNVLLCSIKAQSPPL